MRCTPAAAERSERELRKASELLAEKSKMEERLRGWRCI